MEDLKKDVIYGFLRLRITNEYTLSELTDCALIRELHVYGFNTAVGTQAVASQHRGIGKKLLQKAEHIAFMNFWPGIAVISGEGVKLYYEKLGYSEHKTYMIKYFWLIRLMSIFLSFFMRLF